MSRLALVANAIMIICTAASMFSGLAISTLEPSATLCTDCWHTISLSKVPEALHRELERAWPAGCVGHSNIV